jgi:hypothetical protein
MEYFKISHGGFLFATNAAPAYFGPHHRCVDLTGYFDTSQPLLHITIEGTFVLAKSSNCWNEIRVTSKIHEY